MVRRRLCVGLLRTREQRRLGQELRPASILGGKGDECLDRCHDHIQRFGTKLGQTKRRPEVGGVDVERIPVIVGNPLEFSDELGPPPLKLSMHQCGPPLPHQLVGQAMTGRNSVEFTDEINSPLQGSPEPAFIVSNVVGVIPLRAIKARRLQAWQDLTEELRDPGIIGRGGR